MYSLQSSKNTDAANFGMYHTVHTESLMAFNYISSFGAMTFHNKQRYFAKFFSKTSSIL